MAERGKQSGIAMNIKNTRMIFYLLAIPAIFLGCHRSMMPENQTIPFRSIRCWGGDNQRSGTSQESISSELEHCWTYNATSAAGNAILAADHYLFFGTKDGRITVLDIRNGKSVHDFGTRRRTETTCLVGPRHLIVVQRTPGPTLRCIDLSTAKTRWKRDADDVDGEPLLVGDTLVAVNIQGLVMAIDARTGKTLWERKMDGSFYNSPAQCGDALFLAADNGKLWSMDIDSGRIHWQTRLEVRIAATPVLDADKIYIGSPQGRFFALSQTDGSVLWQRETTGGIFETASVLENRVYFGTSQGIFYCLDSEDGTILWQHDTGSVIGTSPLVTKEHVFFGTLNRMLLMADRRTGEIVWQFEAKGRIRTTPLIWNDMLIFASEDRYIYGFVEKK
jgi:outer membrane protein assembly factor BamB